MSAKQPISHIRRVIDSAANLITALKSCKQDEFLHEETPARLERKAAELLALEIGESFKHEITLRRTLVAACNKLKRVHAEQADEARRKVKPSLGLTPRRTTTFTKGSGCYTCRLCKRQTRDDGNGDSVMIALCTQCYGLGGLSNMQSDNGGGPLEESLRKEAETLVAELDKLGAFVQPEWREMAAKPAPAIPDLLTPAEHEQTAAYRAATDEERRAIAAAELAREAVAAAAKPLNATSADLADALLFSSCNPITQADADTMRRTVDAACLQLGMCCLGGRAVRLTLPNGRALLVSLEE